VSIGKRIKNIKKGEKHKKRGVHKIFCRTANISNYCQTPLRTNPVESTKITEVENKKCNKTGRTCYSYDQWLRTEIIRLPECKNCPLKPKKEDENTGNRSGNRGDT
jgi:hypothetical protein